MNFPKLNLSQLKLSDWRLPQLTPSQWTLIGSGVAGIVSLYVLLLFVRWWKGRKLKAADAPRMRPRGTSRVPASAKSVSKILPAKPVASAQKRETSTPVSPASVASTTAPQGSASTRSTAVSTRPEQSIPASSSERSQKYGSSMSWPVEPKTFEKRNLFEDVGVEYPWADGSDYAFGSATTMLSDMMPSTEEGRRTLTRSLRNAGYYSPHAWQNLSAVRYLGLILPIVLFGLLLVIVPESLEPYMVAGLVIGPALGWALPTLYVRSRAAERLREIEYAMPDMLDLLNMCVAQGMTVPASLRRVGQDLRPVYPALSQELRIVADQARVGHLTEALSNLSDRVDTPEVHSFSSLLIQTEEMGTSVSAALSDYSDSMRETQRQRADEKANAATFKLLFPTVLCLMPAVFLFLMGPALIELNGFFSNGGLQGLDRGAERAFEAQAQRQL